MTFPSWQNGITGSKKHDALMHKSSDENKNLNTTLNNNAMDTERDKNSSASR